MGGAAQPSGPTVLALPGLCLEQSSSLPLCRLLHAYQAVAHSWHSKTQIHRLVLMGAARAEEEAREHQEAGCCSCSLSD